MIKFVVFLALWAMVCSEDAPKTAVVKIASDNVKGELKIFQNTDNTLTIEGTIFGLTTGKHGFHVHEKGDLSKNCTGAGGHFNPEKKNHGAPEDEDRHVGDLGNIEADDNGTAKVNITDKLIALSGTNNIIGRAIVIHADPDDLGLGGFDDSKTTGHAGLRVACGIIVVARSVANAPIDSGDIKGDVTFTQYSDDTVEVEGIITGLAPGLHGFHIHEKGDLSDNCQAVGAHFNPNKKNHGAPEDEDRHVGDLGNIEADDKGVARFKINDKLISLSGANSVLNRAVAIHADADDLGLGGFEDSKTTGHAGLKIACGIIQQGNSANKLGTNLGFMLILIAVMHLLISP
ncbi:extracellular superoxide dismutase [Cu-Zn] 3 [Aethina tumida]|uniref:extracellular superoxide dismutase [Cu-Zn] 3 n=1 Tax=Aethina tumida TaxID=116153 RepID=UPI0021490A9E|nr:extracellular superoxide dismutase [Cu-Zn] 3 [Aethina tumida]